MNWIWEWKMLKTSGRWGWQDEAKVEWGKKMMQSCNEGRLRWGKGAMIMKKYEAFSFNEGRLRWGKDAKRK